MNCIKNLEERKPSKDVFAGVARGEVKNKKAHITKIDASTDLRSFLIIVILTPWPWLRPGSGSPLRAWRKYCGRVSSLYFRLQKALAQCLDLNNRPRLAVRLPTHVRLGDRSEVVW